MKQELIKLTAALLILLATSALATSVGTSLLYGKTTDCPTMLAIDAYFQAHDRGCKGWSSIEVKVITKTNDKLLGEVK